MSDSTFRLRRTILALLLLMAFAINNPESIVADSSASCDEVCNPTVPCDTPCNGTYAEEPWDTICGNHYNGAAGGWCDGGCGDGVCNDAAGEDNLNCDQDCDAQDFNLLGRINFPEDGPAWSSRTSNWPNPYAVGSCYGNCGPGCSQYDATICEPHFRYWQLEQTSATQTNFGTTCNCIDNNNALDCGDVTMTTASGRWTYYGFSAAGCYTHDTTCRTPWWVSVVSFIGGIWLVPGTGWWDLIVQIVFNPYASCKFSFSSFAYGGACAGAGPEQWSYDTTLYLEEFTHTSFEYGAPGSCYQGPPICGDAICQTENCQYAEQAPGNGCEENDSNCGNDCQ